MQLIFGVGVLQLRLVVEKPMTRLYPRLACELLVNISQPASTPPFSKCSKILHSDVHLILAWVLPAVYSNCGEGCGRTQGHILVALENYSG